MAEMGKKLGYFSSLVIFFAFIYLQKSNKKQGRNVLLFLPTWSAEEFVGDNHALTDSCKDIRVYHLLAGYINMLVYSLPRKYRLQTQLRAEAIRFFFGL